MQDYNQFVTSINIIFDCLSKLRAGWNNQDNYNYIDAIEEFKTAITNNADVFKQARRELDPEEIKELEERAAQEAAEEAAKEAEKNSEQATQNKNVEVASQPQQEQSIETLSTGEENTQQQVVDENIQPEQVQQPVVTLSSEPAPAPVQPVQQQEQATMPQINQPAQSATEVVEKIQELASNEEQTIKEETVTPQIQIPIPNLVGAKGASEQ